MFSLDDFGVPVEYAPTRKSSDDNNAQFARNIDKQLDLFNGSKDVLSSTGKAVAPTWKLTADKQHVIYGLKFGGSFVKLDGHRTHFKVPADTFPERLKWLAEQAEEGWFEIQLNGISDSIKQRLQGGRKKSQVVLNGSEASHA